MDVTKNARKRVDERKDKSYSPEHRDAFRFFRRLFSHLFFFFSFLLFVELHEKARKNLALTRGVAVEVDAHEGHEFVGNNVGHLN